MYCFEKLSDEQLQAYINITWSILDLISATDDALETYKQWKPSLEQVIYQAIEYVQDENIVPHLESRLLTMFNLVRPKEVSYEFAQDVYITQREPTEDTEIKITLSIAFEVSAGFCLIHDMEWPDWKWWERYIVLENPLHDGLYLNVAKSGKLKCGAPPPKPKSKKSKGGSTKYENPRGAPPNFIPDVLRRHNLKNYCPIFEGTGILNSGMTIFSFQDGELKIWSGSWLKFGGGFFQGFNIPTPIGSLVFSRPNRDLTSFSSRAAAIDITDYLSNSKFWRWFHTIALRGYITAAPDNDEKNSWFFKKDENGMVSLDKPVKVGTLKRFLGGAYWADSEKTKMSFTGIFDAKILVGSLKTTYYDEDYLALEWISNNKRNKKEWGYESEIEVDDDMDVGEES